MSRRILRILAIAFAACGMAGCGVPPESIVLSMAQQDLECPRRQLEIVDHNEIAAEDGSERFVVTGCGRTAVYACFGQYDRVVGDPNYTCCNLEDDDCGDDY